MWHSTLPGRGRSVIVALAFAHFSNAGKNLVKKFISLFLLGWLVNHCLFQEDDNFMIPNLWLVVFEAHPAFFIVGAY